MRWCVSFLLWWLVVLLFSFFLTPLPISLLWSVMELWSHFTSLSSPGSDLTYSWWEKEKPWTSQYYISKTCAYKPPFTFSSCWNVLNVLSPIKGLSIRMLFSYNLPYCHEVALLSFLSSLCLHFVTLYSYPFHPHLNWVAPFILNRVLGKWLEYVSTSLSKIHGLRGKECSLQLWY